MLDILSLRMSSIPYGAYKQSLALRILCFSNVGTKIFLFQSRNDYFLYITQLRDKDMELR